MSKGKIEIIETCCRRCGKSIRTLSHSIIGADDAREKAAASRRRKITS